VVDFVSSLHTKTDIAQGKLVRWLGLARSKFYGWKQRYGKANEHNGLVPRDFWLLEWERDAIVGYFIQHPDEGYRRLAYLMMDADLVAVSPSTVYRTLKGEGLLGRRDVKPSKKGTGFVQPLWPHQEWHIDVTYINLSGTFYYLCSVLDGFSRYIVHWEVREAMKEPDVELIVQKALEAFPGVHPKLISDNGPQFIAKDFKEFIRLAGMTHVRTSPYYPQSNRKQERMQGTVKRECIREKCPRTVEEARCWVGEYIERYNTQRLHSAIGYVTPLDMLEGRQEAILAERDRKLEAAREQRRQTRQSNQLPVAV
jgi:putative transposase